MASLWVAFMTLPAFATAMTYTRISPPPGSPPPMKTAAAELAARTGAQVVRRGPAEAVQEGEIALVLGERIHAYPEAAALLPADAGAREYGLKP